MKLSAYKALLLECPRTAMIFDLTERFPRGPRANLRPKHYKVTETETWRGVNREVHNDAFIGGEDGYDLFKLYELTRKSWWESSLTDLTTTIEAASMGHAIYGDVGDNGYGPTGQWRLFKYGAQVTRRLNRLKERLRDVVRLVEHASSANLYRLQVGRLDKPVCLFADSEQAARIQYDLLLSAAFNTAASQKAFHAGYGRYDDGSPDVRVHFHGPSHGPHEIMEKNQELSTHLRQLNEERLAKIEELKTAIEASEELAQMIDMTTINMCAQTFEEKA